MESLRFNSNKKKSLFIPDRYLLSLWFELPYTYMLLENYENIYTSERNYEYFMKTLPVEKIGEFTDTISEGKFHINEDAIDSIRDLYPSIEDNDAYAILAGMQDKDMEIMIDDPRKIYPYSKYKSNVINASDFIIKNTINDLD